MSISENRFQVERIRSRKKNYKSYNVVTNSNIGRLVRTPSACSCWMCGNPRKFFGELTVQEKKFLDIEKEFHEDVY